MWWIYAVNSSNCSFCCTVKPRPSIGDIRSWSGTPNGARCQLEKNKAPPCQTHSAIAKASCVTRHDTNHTDKKKEVSQSSTMCSLRADSYDASTGCLIQIVQSFLNIQTRYIENNKVIIIVRIWLYKVLHSPTVKSCWKPLRLTRRVKGHRISNDSSGALFSVWLADAVAPREEC